MAAVRHLGFVKLEIFNGDCLCQWEMAIFDPPQNKHPSTITKKFGTGDYVGGPYGCAKFGANPSMRGFWANK